MGWFQVRTFLSTSVQCIRRGKCNRQRGCHADHNTAYITAETVMDFQCRPKEKYCDKPVVLVLDNAEYQHCKAVMEKAGELGITLLFLPPYSPNLNIIERLWMFTKKQILGGVVKVSCYNWLKMNYLNVCLDKRGNMPNHIYQEYSKK
jgi:hypothetical protein